MSLRLFIYSYYLKVPVALTKRRILKQAGPAQFDRSDWERSLRQPTEFYEDCFRFFHQRLPPPLREHRQYFSVQGRGFNEDAMHTMWFLLFGEFKPANFLEIGIYRGQTISLAALLARHHGVPCQVHGISPFSSAGDATTNYSGKIDYLTDTLHNFRHFGLPEPALLKKYSTDPEAVDLIRSTSWEMIYIDGNHDYEIARRDWEICSKSAKRGGIIVLDDSGLETAYRPVAFATAGHPGPSRLAREIDRNQFREILHVGHNRVFQKL